MKMLLNSICCLFIIATLGSCKEQKDLAITEINVDQDKEYISVGKKITLDSALDINQLSEKMQSLKDGDTIDAKVRAEVKEVCQAKGCWMTLNSDTGEEIMVKFKDYGFFVPKDISGREVILEGSAFIDEVSVEDQKHYAMDEGQSQEEIDKITTPKKSFAIIAEGVLVAED